MNRTFLLVSAVVCWTIVAVDALVHLISGDVIVPAGMAAVFVLWVGLRQLQARELSQVRVAARITDRT
jgi:hypothetical protein